MACLKKSCPEGNQPSELCFTCDPNSQLFALVMDESNRRDDCFMLHYLLGRASALAELRAWVHWPLGEHWYRLRLRLLTCYASKWVKAVLCTWLKKCCRQFEAKEVSNCRNKNHQTMYTPGRFRVLLAMSQYVPYKYSRPTWPMIFQQRIFILSVWINNYM